MNIQLVRHATLLIEFHNQRLLIDPICSPEGSMDPVPDVPNTHKNPLVNLTVPLSTLLEVDAVLLTHLHRDHFDPEAARLLPKNLPVFCQPEDTEAIQAHGFRHVSPVSSSLTWEGITLHRTGGQHGSGEMAQRMGPVSGFVLEAQTEPTLYISGDTVWCPEVKQALHTHTPDVVVCFAGGAQFAEGPPITMTSTDILHVSNCAPHARIVAVHMEAWNHCRLSRSELRTFADANDLSSRLLIPEDGDIITFMA
ncbi:MBL fold metallo-hydrolase [Aneurinibacillus uraniidurans]|uniref:MBL fold metallo-hydrolase n=1 Tax=Aneurinibacillus uraniidurans TaxID=2966586 RepID=UPI00234B143A|nr:MBL fold metallo-hydrolase [Aneurinibacillus sp. B1]WCN38200.1 MBL fold metallo-hydrolase [Aneurinibacillus sp. B1]